MKVSVYNAPKGAWEPALDRSMLRIEDAGVMVTLVVRDDRLDISVDPINSEWVNRLATHEVYVSELQDRLSVSGKRDEKTPPQTDGQYPSVDPA